MATVVALFGPRRGLAHALDRRLLVGRSQDADVQLLDEQVSREHCVLEPAADGGHLVRDLGSRNGTWVNGARVSGDARLRAGDEIGIGETVLVYEPSFEALRARDGESTLILTAAKAGGSRTGPAAGQDGLRSAGELALRAAMAATPLQAAALLAESALASLGVSAVAVLAAADGSVKPLLARPLGANLSVGRALLDAALREGKPLAMPEAQARAERHAEEKTTLVRRRDAEVLCAPAFAAGQPVAALCLARERPFSPEEIALAGALAAAVGPALAAPAVRASEPRPEPPVAQSAAMKEALRLAEAAARTPSTVLILGETGTGKEEIARTIHRAGPRAKKPFVAVNCAAIPAELAESELFGHEKGAFTGALAAHEGAFERADEGTLFLDEVGDLPLALQAKLLRLLQDRLVQRVGGRSPVPVDVRVVAATHRDLRAMVKAGTFREDLYWRLEVVPIALAPLRDRPEDVVPLAERFLARLSAQLGRRAEGFTPECKDALARCAWPGNARQLANAVERALVLKQDDGPIGVADLPAEVAAPALPASPAPPPGGGRKLGDVIASVEREQITLALRRARGVKSAAAEALGLSRPTLDRKIDEYGIDLFP